VREHAPDFRRPRVDAYTTALPEDAYCDNWVAENGLRFLHAFPSDQPWHLVINFTGPHSPMDVTASMRARWQDVPLPPPDDGDHPDAEGVLRNRQNYAAMVENIDRHVGRYLDVVRARGELEDTLVVYSSDHGEMLGDHGFWGKGRWYTPSAGIPLIVTGPGIARGVVSEALVSLHDLAATFVDYARVAPMPGMDALSLRTLLEGNASTHREVVTGGLNEWRMVYDGRYKLVTRPGEPPILYDTASDPQEDHDVAAGHPETVSRLRRML
jgi:arylsulfatase A-like enzyme